jgi:hypothetical protein
MSLWTVDGSCGYGELGAALSHLVLIAVVEISTGDDTVTVAARTVSGEAVCPGCGTASSRVHGRYRRRLADLAVASRKVVPSPTTSASADRAALLVELDGHLYIRCGQAGDDQWLTETLGEGPGLSRLGRPGGARRRDHGRPAGAHTPAVGE